MAALLIFEISDLATKTDLERFASSSESRMDRTFTASLFVIVAAMVGMSLSVA